MKRSNRTFALGVVAIAAIAPLAWWLLMSHDVALESVAQRPIIDVVAPALDGGAATGVRLGTVSGRVQFRHADGGWVDADGGEWLAENDGVRTFDGSYALLVGSDSWNVKMEPGTEIALGELSQSISRLLLESGMAHLKGAQHTFEVRVAHSDALARSDGGSFSVATNGRGLVAVGSDNGEVVFTAAGHTVIVRSHERSIAKPGEGPGQPTPVPNSLLLRVAFPSRLTINTPKVVLNGEVEPGSLVEVMGRVVSADERGHFTAPLVLKEGRNRVEVRATGIGGTANSAGQTIELDTTVSGPIIDPRSLWK